MTVCDGAVTLTRKRTVAAGGGWPSCSIATRAFSAVDLEARRRYRDGRHQRLLRAAPMAALLRASLRRGNTFAPWCAGGAALLT